MDLNTIRLNHTLVSSLYPSSLVEDTAAGHTGKPLQTEAPADGWKYLGSNKKNVLLLVKYEDVTHLPDEELGFLTNLLTACKLDLGDVAIVNRNNHPQETYKDYLQYFNSRIVLLFDTDPLGFGLPVDFPQFQIQSFANCTFLYCPALDERKHDQLFKSKLWVCLKRIFNL